MFSRSAMSVLLKPSVIRASTSRSREDSAANAEPDGGRSRLSEREDRLAEPLPCRLVLQQDVVPGVELDELGAGNAARHQPSFGNRNHLVVARVQHQRRRPHVAEQRNDVDAAARRQQP